MTPTTHVAPAPGLKRRRVTGALTLLIAVALTLLSWPVGALVAGMFGVLAAGWCRHWPRTTRIAVLAIGTCVAMSSALLLADFGTGTTTILLR